jgi:hypothetical protein
MERIKSPPRGIDKVIEAYLNDRKTPTPPAGDIEDEPSLVSEILAPAKAAMARARDSVRALADSVDKLAEEVEKKR